jgi:hypothetical protein
VSSSIRFDSNATCASGLPVSVAEAPYFEMISFLTDGCNAIWCSFYFHEGLGVIHEGSIARLLCGQGYQRHLVSRNQLLLVEIYAGKSS